MSAFSCRPDAGSEPGAGWELALAAAQHNDVWLLTRRRDEEVLAEAIRARPGTSLTPVFVDVAARLQTRFGAGPRLYAHYLSWQLVAAARARQLQATVGFDVGHHVTFATDWLPTPLSAVRGLPLVWGPVGGYAPLPWQLVRWLGWRGLGSELLRVSATGLLRKGIGDATARRSALVVATNADVARRFAPVARHVVVEPNTAAVPIRHGGGDTSAPDGRARRSAEPGSARTAVFVGRILPWKGLALAVAALARPSAGRWSLDVIGAGPDKERVGRLAQRLGVAHRVQFLGRLPRSEVLQRISDADALLQPSMHEAGGFAVTEAVALGCPVVCLDRGGPAVIVDVAAQKVPVSVHAARDLATALDRIGTRPSPTDRWSEQRLVHCCDNWYQSATASSA